MHRAILKTVLLTGIALILSSGSAWASNTLDDTILRLTNNLVNLPTALSFFAYIMSAFFMILSLVKFWKHVEDGPQNAPLSTPFKYLAASGLLSALPVIGNLATNTVGNTGASQEIAISNLAWAAPASSSGTLDAMLTNFVKSIYEPSQLLISFTCFIMGFIFLIIAIQRLTKTAQEGAKGPVGAGTIATFLLAGGLLSIGPSVGTFTETIFGGRQSLTKVEFLGLSSSMSTTASAHAESVVVSILAFLILVGIIAIIRGFFTLRDVAEGSQQATMMGGLSFIIAGAILVNFGEFANIIQNTLGINSYGVLFST